MLSLPEGYDPFQPTGTGKSQGKVHVGRLYGSDQMHGAFFTSLAKGLVALP